MRITAQIELQEPELPLDHRRVFISLLKLGLTQFGGSSAVERYYGKAMQKPYTFALYLPNGRFAERISLDSASIRMLISTNDYRCFGDFCNALSRLRGRQVEVCGICMTVTSISLGKETCVTSGRITIKLLSPLVLRKHDRESGRDEYYTVDDDCFEERLRESISAQARMLGVDEAPVEGLRVLDIAGAKRTVVSHFNKRFRATVGQLSLSGDPAMLEWLRAVGMGSLRSSGFGMFDVVSQEVNTGG